jgi:hypothetical protein
MDTVFSKSTIKHWPAPQDYNEAIQNPLLNLRDPVLRNCAAVANSLGLPKPVSGAFATVYQMKSDQTSWAIRCFLHDVQDQEHRYKEISEFIARANLPYLVDFDYQPLGIRVNGNFFPVLKMEWVTGQTLEHYIELNLHDSAKLRLLQQRFKEMCVSLSSHGIVHGDLQHGNILVQEDGTLRLVDYDGMYVPSMSGLQANELGHRNYQHPGRSANHFGYGLDNFAAWVIYVSIAAIAEDPSIFRMVRGGNDCLLFRKEDFENVRTSKVFMELSRKSEQIRTLSDSLKWLVSVDTMTVLPLGQPAPARGSIGQVTTANSSSAESPWYMSEQAADLAAAVVDRMRANQSARQNAILETELTSSSRRRLVSSRRQHALYQGPKFIFGDCFYLVFVASCGDNVWGWACLLLLASLVAFALSWFFNIERNVLLRGIPTKGKLRKRRTDRQHLTPVFTLNYDFKTVDNQGVCYLKEVECSEEVYSMVTDGETVTILYSKTNPERSIIYKLSRYRVRVD